MFKEIAADALLAVVALYGSSMQAKQQQIIAEGRMPDAVSRTVSYADLNLADDGQVNILKIRVKKAVRVVCGEVYDSHPNSDLWGEYHCIRLAHRRTTSQIKRAVARALTSDATVKMAEVKISVVKH